VRRIIESRRGHVTQPRTLDLLQDRRRQLRQRILSTIRHLQRYSNSSSAMRVTWEKILGHWESGAQSWAPAGMGKRGHLPPPPPHLKCCNVFLCINNYSKTLSRRIIYALFSQIVVSFCMGLCPQTRTGAPSRDPAGDFRFHFQTPNLPNPGKKSCGRLWTPYWGK